MNESPESLAMSPEPTTLGVRMMNVLVAPGETWEAVRSEAYHSINWWLPLILGIVAGLIFVLGAFSQPTVLDEILVQQATEIEKAVAAGKLTEAQADAAHQQMESMRPMIGTLARVFGSIGTALASVAFQFIVAGLLMAGGRWWLGTSVPYWKWMEVTGLASLVPAMGALVTLCLVMIKGSLYVTAGPALLFSDVRPGSALQVLLGALTVFNLWWCALLTGGLARLSGRLPGRAAVWVFGWFALLTGIAVGVAALRS